jgi:hypothetical protein
MAIISRDAYESPEEAQRRFKKLGYESQLVQRGDTQAYVLSNHDSVVVAYRGTENSTDLQAGADVLLDENRAGKGRFHSGYQEEADRIFPDISEQIRAADPDGEKAVFSTGHSMGGALAEINSSRLRRDRLQTNKSEIYTFGAPPIGDKEAVAEVDRESKMHRIRDDRDPVANSVLYGYQKPPGVSLAQPTEETTVQRYSSWIQKKSGIPVKSISRDPLKHHSMDTYISQIETQQQTGRESLYNDRPIPQQNVAAESQPQESPQAPTPAPAAQAPAPVAQASAPAPSAEVQTASVATNSSATLISAEVERY